MQDRLVRMALVLLCIAMGAIAAAAQITTGVVTGALKDEQGAVVPGATVTLVSDTRGTKVADAHTNENGDFVFPNVPGDTYTLEVTLEGFKTMRRAGVLVSPGDRVVVPTMTLTVGGLGETVNVKAEAPMIQAASGERAFTVTTESVENLPIANRNFAGFATLVPGAIALSGTAIAGGVFRLGGGGQNNIMMDGVSTMDTGNNGQLISMNVDSIAEVKVLTQGYQAEFGRSSGLQISAVTKSGTNRFRGSVYDIERNSDWNSNSWANVKNGDPKPVLEAARLGLFDRRTGRETRRRQQAVLLLQPRVPAASGRRRHQSLPSADRARAAGGFFADTRQQRRTVQHDQGLHHGTAVNRRGHPRVFPGRRRARADPAEPSVSDRHQHPEQVVAAAECRTGPRDSATIMKSRSRSRARCCISRCSAPIIRCPRRCGSRRNTPGSCT